jgi:hypothetical protein
MKENLVHTKGDIYHIVEILSSPESMKRQLSASKIGEHIKYDEQSGKYKGDVYSKNFVYSTFKGT